MRISGGEWRGRAIDVPRGDAVRPTQDMVREALFSILQSVVPGAKFLDLFAGSGAVGFEALSRGAAMVTAVEADPRHLAVIRRNVERLGCAGRFEAVAADAYAWISSAGRGRAFDIAFADPPYDLALAKGFAGMLAALAESGAVAEGGIFVAEMRASEKPDCAPGWEMLRDRRYGQTRIAVYRLAAAAGSVCASSEF